MKKREFLAMGGAVPLMLAGCGGNGGSANVRLVNASVGYPSLGFMVGTTQAVSDIAYGNASAFESVDSGSVSTNLTTTDATTGTVTDLPTTTRSLSKGSRYSLVAYGYSGSPKAVLILENQDDPDSGYAKFNVLNTSTDIGAVDVYLTASPTLASGATAIVTNLSGVAQSTFQQITAGTYYLTVTGYNKKADVRLSVTTAITLTNQKIYTLILSPGNSGVLANGILLRQASDGEVVNYPNTKARVRAIAATDPSLPVTVNGIISGATSPYQSSYQLVDISSTGTNGAVPAVTVNGTTITSLSTATLSAGNDYTILVYGLASSVTAQLLLDDNTLPTVSGYVKVGLLNAVVTTDGSALPLTLNFNSQAVASDIATDSISTYSTVVVPTQLSSTASVTKGTFATIISSTTVSVTAGNTYLAVVAGVYNPSTWSLTSNQTLAMSFLSART